METASGTPSNPVNSAKRIIEGAGALCAPVTTYLVKKRSKFNEPIFWLGIEADLVATVVCFIPAYLQLHPLLGVSANEIGAFLSFSIMKVIAGLGLSKLLPYMVGK